MGQGRFLGMKVCRAASPLADLSFGAFACLHGEMAVLLIC